MDLVPSPDQDAMIEMIHRFLEERLSVRHVHERLRTGAAVEAQQWAHAGDVGVFSLGLPDAAGGAALPSVEEALVFRELGRELAPVGFLASVIAARMAHLAGDSALRDSIVSGRSPVAAALEARESGCLYVFGLHAAKYVLHWSSGTPLLSEAEAFADREPLEGLDPSACLTRAVVPSGPPVLGTVDAAAEHLSLLGTLLSAAMLTGIAEAARDASVSHAKEREQFGRPIGVNQAIKHPCADMATRCEAAASLLFFAACALRDGRPDAPFQVAAAKRIAADAAAENSRANVQIHGGMGVTWEHDAHLYVTRARVLTQLFTDAEQTKRYILATAPSVP
jgi:alkylation response protein AidB-like acyl-CoA dehydrogenase